MIGAAADILCVGINAAVVGDGDLGTRGLGFKQALAEMLGRSAAADTQPVGIRVIMVGDGDGRMRKMGLKKLLAAVFIFITPQRWQCARSLAPARRSASIRTTSCGENISS